MTAPPAETCTVTGRSHTLALRCCSPTSPVHRTLSLTLALRARTRSSPALPSTNAKCNLTRRPFICVIIHGTADRMAAQHVRPSSSMSSGKHDELIVAYEALQLQELAPQEIVGLAHLGLVTRLGVVVHAREALVEAA